LKKLVVLHSSEEFFEDIRSLEVYILEELNVRSVVLTADESQYGVKYRVLVDHKALGTKLRKDAAKVRNGLAAMTSEDAKKFMLTKEVVIEGIRLTDDWCCIDCDSQIAVSNRTALKRDRLI
jgi:isoleucyl-tRNA synthetase